MTAMPPPRGTAMRWDERSTGWSRMARRRSQPSTTPVSHRVAMKTPSGTPAASQVMGPPGKISSPLILLPSPGGNPGAGRNTPIELCEIYKLA